MTTAHRPTFHAAVGGKEQGGGRYIAGVSRQHVHDLPGQMSLKTRQFGQGTSSEISSKDELRAALEAREGVHMKAIGKALRAPPPPPPPVADDDDDDDGPALIVDAEDADDAAAAAVHQKAAEAAAEEEDEESDEEDDEDDEEELMRELERIKKERAQEAARKERESTDEVAAERDSAILQGNPLLDPTRPGAPGESFAVKRRWDDDVVFKNQAREPKKEAKRFINDTVRNDFHRKFLFKYIK